MTRTLVGVRLAIACCTAGAKPIFDRALGAVVVAAAAAGPTAAGAASTPAAATAPFADETVSALAGFAKVATSPPVAATTARALHRRLGRLAGEELEFVEWL